MKHYLRAKDLPEFNQEINQKLEQAFNSIKETIRRIQGFQEDEQLRWVVFTDGKNSQKYISTIEQISTRFCIISLGADEEGRYNVVMSIDQHINEKIGLNLATTLVRRMMEFTPGMLENSFVIHSFYTDCDEILANILEEHREGSPEHQFQINQKFD